MRFLDWLWSLLPDRCEMPDCPRLGIRGNENRINGWLACDYCHARTRPIQTRECEERKL